jgi:hypothetical protein
MQGQVITICRFVSMFAVGHVLYVMSCHVLYVAMGHVLYAMSCHVLYVAMGHVLYAMSCQVCMLQWAISGVLPCYAYVRVCGGGK